MRQTEWHTGDTEAERVWAVGEEAGEEGALSDARRPKHDQGTVHEHGGVTLSRLCDARSPSGHVTRTRAWLAASCLFVFSLSIPSCNGCRLLSPHSESPPRPSRPVVPSLSQPVDFEGDVNLFHFVLLRCVGKGAFGKVLTTPPLFASHPTPSARSEWSSTNKPTSSTPSSTSTNQSASR